MVWNLFQTEQTDATQSGYAPHLPGLGQSEADFRVTRPDCGKGGQAPVRQGWNSFWESDFGFNGTSLIVSKAE